MATRPSPLAIIQARSVASALTAATGTDCEIVPVATRGDADPDTPVKDLGGRGVFATEVQNALADGRADIAVHSAKDLPPVAAAGLVIAAFTEREDPRDVLVGNTLAGLGAGDTVASGSVRRRAQLAHVRPDLSFAELRGNIATRLEKIPPGGAIVMAVAALIRLDLVEQLTSSGCAVEVLATATMLPQVGQGAIAVECRQDDARAREAVAVVDHARTRPCVEAERSYLAALGGSCELPVGALATVAPDGRIVLEALAATTDGTALVRHTCTGRDPAALGEELAARMMADPVIGPAIAAAGSR